MTTTVNLTNEILTALAEVNGAASFDEKTIVDETLTETTYLIVDNVDDLRVTTDAAISNSMHLPPARILLVAYLNYAHLLANKVEKSKALRIAAVRAGIVANGGLFCDDDLKTKFTYRPEIKTIEPPAGFSMRKLDDEYEDREVEVADPESPDLKKRVTKKVITKRGLLTFTTPADHADFLSSYQALDKEEIQRMVKYLPIFAHMAFTKFEHHYIDNDYFRASYEKQFRSLKLNNLVSTWNHANVIYPCIHWMGPYVMKQWCVNLAARELMPRPMAIKFPVIPAGTALICSTFAVLKAAAAIPGFNAFYEVYKLQWTSITEAVRDIKKNPYAYHTRADLFGEKSLEADLSASKDHAAALAPAAQAFINKYAANTDLARIMAIKKHAEANLGLMRRYETIFAGNATQARAEARHKTIYEMIKGATSPAARAPGVVETFEEEAS